MVRTPVPHVWAATVIDNLGAAAVHRPIDGPHPVKFDSVGFLAMLEPAEALLRSNDLPDILDHVASSGDGLCGEDAPTVNSRFANSQAEAGEAGIHARLCSYTIRPGTGRRQ